MNERNSSHQQELADLRKEVKILRRYRRMIRAQRKGLSALGQMSILVFLGPELSAAVSQWLKAKGNEEGVPVEYTANLIAALARRIIRVGLVAIVLALIPTALLLWQNLIMRDQYAALIFQIDEQRKQTENQQITSYFPLLLTGKRTNFWAAVSFFSSSEERRTEAISRLSGMLLESEAKGACSALEALARLSPSNPLSDGMLVRDVTDVLTPLIPYQKIPLGGIEIRELECEELRLIRAGISQMSFRGANLKNSEFTYVDLSGTSFEGADLRGVHFRTGIQWSSEEADSPADFTDADLRYAYFGDEISDVNLNGASLAGALFTRVTGHGLENMPLRYFRGAHCMSPKEAEECHKWHLGRFREGELDPQTDDKPSSCPTSVVHPIISVYGHEKDRQECREWLHKSE